MKDILRLLRYKQWIKNLVVFLPGFFSGRITDTGCLLQVAGAFAAFCLISSAIYCINDIKDVEADRRHPVKCKRPIASGLVSIRTAIATATLLPLLSLTCTLLLDNSLQVAAVIVTYYLLNIAYCFRLKQFAIIDVFCIATGFVLRIVAGGIAGDIWLSPWIVSLTFLLTLFMGFAKRRDDVIMNESGAKVTRKNTLSYNKQFLDQTMSILAAAMLVSYIIYSVSPEVESRLGSNYVYVTSIAVLAGILRYMQLVIVNGEGGSPTRIVLHDRFLQACIAVWLLMFLFIIY